MTDAYYSVYDSLKFIKMLIIMIRNQDMFQGEMGPSVKFNIKTSNTQF